MKHFKLHTEPRNEAEKAFCTALQDLCKASNMNNCVFLAKTVECIAEKHLVAVKVNKGISSLNVHLVSRNCLFATISNTNI